jgi:hypothetical protein
MSNQVILWSMLIVPLMTLIFMPREDIKRYMPAGLLVTLTSILAYDIGISYGCWALRETTYPLAVIPTFFMDFF